MKNELHFLMSESQESPCTCVAEKTIEHSSPTALRYHGINGDPNPVPDDASNYHPLYALNVSFRKKLEQRWQLLEQEMRGLEQKILRLPGNIDDYHSAYPVVTPSLGNLGCFDDNVLTKILSHCQTKSKHNLASTCKTLYRLSAFNCIKTIEATDAGVCDPHMYGNIVSAIEKNDPSAMFKLGSCIHSVVHQQIVISDGKTILRLFYGGLRQYQVIIKIGDRSFTVIVELKGVLSKQRQPKWDVIKRLK
ncbi:MAG: F-box protein [Sulfobacillus sp.]